MSPESGRQCVPFWLRRPLLLVKVFKVDRDDPDLAASLGAPAGREFCLGCSSTCGTFFCTVHPCFTILDGTYGSTGIPLLSNS